MAGTQRRSLTRHDRVRDPVVRPYVLGLCLELNWIARYVCGGAFLLNARSCLINIPVNPPEKRRMAPGSGTACERVVAKMTALSSPGMRIPEASVKVTENVPDRKTGLGLPFTDTAEFGDSVPENVADVNMAFGSKPALVKVKTPPGPSVTFATQSAPHCPFSVRVPVSVSPVRTGK